MSPIHHVVYADPPWSFATYSHKGKGRSAEAYYNCMSLADIKALPVTDWTAADCVLLLWATDPMLPQALKVIRAWGFTYKTVGFYWVKASERFDRKPSYFTGMGYWTRANPEQCLLATRGHPVRWNRDVRKLIISPRASTAASLTRSTSGSSGFVPALISSSSRATRGTVGPPGVTRSTSAQLSGSGPLTVIRRRK